MESAQAAPTGGSIARKAVHLPRKGAVVIWHVAAVSQANQDL